MYVTVEVEVDREDILGAMTDDDLRGLGLERKVPINRPKTWSEVAGAIRRGDFERASQMLTIFAQHDGGDLPPFAITKAA
jgi:hypothetical protein